MLSVPFCAALMSPFQSTPDLINRENAKAAHPNDYNTQFQSTPDLINRENPWK